MLHQGSFFNDAEKFRPGKEGSLRCFTGPDSLKRWTLRRQKREVRGARATMPGPERNKSSSVSLFYQTGVLLLGLSPEQALAHEVSALGTRRCPGRPSTFRRPLLNHFRGVLNLIRFFFAQSSVGTVGTAPFGRRGEAGRSSFAPPHRERDFSGLAISGSGATTISRDRCHRDHLRNQ